MILALCFGVLGVGKAWEYEEGMIFTLKNQIIGLKAGNNSLLNGMWVMEMGSLL